jgi:hypothetical protein
MLLHRTTKETKQELINMINRSVNNIKVKKKKQKGDCNPYNTVSIHI